MWLENYALLTNEVISSDANIPGTGAAGGMGFALLSYLDATLMSGIKLVMKEIDIERHIKEADLDVTLAWLDTSLMRHALKFNKN